MKQKKLVASTAFEVTQYVLPAFKIDFTLPSFIFSTDTSVNIMMNVSYTFGKPVRGTVYYRYGIADLGAKRNSPKFLQSTSTFCFDGGFMSHRVDLGWLKEQVRFAARPNRKPELRFVVEATVRECATHAQERKVDSSSVAIVEHGPYSFNLAKTVRWYKPLMDNYFAVSSFSRSNLEILLICKPFFSLV